MAVRTLLFTVDEECVFPEKMQWGGVQNEHNASIVRFVLEEEFLQSLGENLKYRIDFTSDWAGYDPSENLTYDGYIERAIPRKFTQNAGKMQAVLVVSKVIDNEAVEEFISIPVEIFFTVSKRKDKRIIENLSAYEEYVCGLITEVAETADKAQQQVQNIEEKLANGEFDGKDGVDGKDYILTDSDKIEIAQIIRNDTFVDVSEVGQ